MSDDILNGINDKIDKLTDKVDYIKDNITDIKVIQARHDENLKEHMRRTSLLEVSDQRIIEELKPIKLHVSQVDGVFKFIAVGSTIIGAILGALKLLGKI